MTHCRKRVVASYAHTNAVTNIFSIPYRKKERIMNNMKTAIGASLPSDLFREFNLRVEGFPGGKTGLIKECLRAFFDANPLTEEQKRRLAEPELAEVV